MRRTGATRDTSRREQDSTSQRESGSAERTAPEEPLAALHRAGGNQAVQSLAGRERVDRAASEGVGGVSDGGEPLLRGPTADLCPRCISRYRAGKSLDCEECESALDGGAGGQAVEASTDGPTVQPKLAVSDPDDRYEREAERVAEAVMRDDAGASPERGGKRAPEAVQRMCSACQERFRRGKPLNCEECEAELQRATDSSGGEVDGDVAGQVRSARTGGRPLPEQTRSYFESRMGRDFGDVRVHTGAQADEAARSLNARAFTLGSDVVFRAGEYRPHTRSGKRLLAHELTHVVQQGRRQGGPDPTAQRQVAAEKTRDPPDTYTVREGDTLWDIAEAYYGDGSEWPKIYGANRDLIGDNPDHIEPRWELDIPNGRYPDPEPIMPPVPTGDPSPDLDQPEGVPAGPAISAGVTDCPTEKEKAVTNAHKRAITGTSDAVSAYNRFIGAARRSSDLDELETELGERTARLLSEGWDLPIWSVARANPDIAGPFSTDVNLRAVTSALEEIMGVYWTINNALKEGDFNYECQDSYALIPNTGCDPGVNAFVTPLTTMTGWGNVHICPDAPIENQEKLAKTIVHEVGHYYAGLKDETRTKLDSAYHYDMNAFKFPTE